MNCQICDEEEAIFTVIPVGEGLPQILGPVCFARAGLDLAKALLPAEEIASILGPMFVGPPFIEEVTAKAEAELKRPRKSKAEEPAPEGTTGGEDAPSAAASDQ